MSGFKKFVLQGNLVEIAVAFIIALSFATVVTTFVAVIMSLIGKIFGKPNFDTIRPGGVPLGAFVTALVAFATLAAIVYFFVVKPYEFAKDRWMASGKMEKTDVERLTEIHVELLTEIRDLLARRDGV